MAAPDIVPEKASPLDIPEHGNICSLSIVDTTCVLTVPGNTLVEPTIPGHELMNFPTLAFLITNAASNRQVVFDLGCQKDFWNLPPPIAEVIDAKVPGMKVDKNLVEVLTEGGVDVTKLEAAVISHHHYDHVGDPRTLPTSVDLIVGPGFSEEFLPGYPTRQNSPVFESAFKDRNVQELTFSGGLVVAGYPAVDYFADGSLYILNSPGHAIGHLSALVRTTPGTFVFLGGDICHFGGSFRPTRYVPMPKSLNSEDVGRADQETKVYDASVFTACHPNLENARVSPYYTPCCSADSWYVNPPIAQQSIDKLELVDADERILVLIAHDPPIMKVVKFFPNGVANDWQRAGWKEKLRWGFLNELPVFGEQPKYLVDGLYINGKRVKTLTGESLE